MTDIILIIKNLAEQKPWLTGFVGLYWIYCLFWGFKGARSAKTSADYFLAGRSIGIWVFVLAATALITAILTAVWFLIWLIRQGETSSNKYGPDPRVTPR